MEDRDSEVLARIGASGRVRVPASVRRETSELVAALENPAVRRGAERQLGGLSGGGGVRRRLLAGSLLAAAGLGVTVPAAASVWLARTGEFGDPSSSTEVSDRSEWIDLSAPDVPEVILEVYPDYLALPAGVPPEAAAADVTRVFDRLMGDAEGAARAQESLMVQSYEEWAICAWTAEWLDARAANDEERSDRAVAWLEEPSNFPAMVAADGGGVIDALLGFADAARSGDLDTVEDAYAMQQCHERLAEVRQ